MNRIAQTIEEISHSLPATTRLVAVSKFQPEEAILAAYAAGQRLFGESRVQELQRKAAALPADIEWHFIGHLQSNKIKQLIPLTSLIHSVDSRNLLEEINRMAAQQGRTVDCLMQLHIAQEESKFGWSTQECTMYLASGEWRTLTHVRLVGMMAMATNTDDTTLIEEEFATAQRLFQMTKERWFADEPYFEHLSIGMSSDYPSAIRHGSTLVRIGSRIFGERI